MHLTKIFITFHVIFALCCCVSINVKETNRTQTAATSYGKDNTTGQLPTYAPSKNPGTRETRLATASSSSIGDIVKAKSPNSMSVDWTTVTSCVFVAGCVAFVVITLRWDRKLQRWQYYYVQGTFGPITLERYVYITPPASDSLNEWTASCSSASEVESFTFVRSKSHAPGLGTFTIANADFGISSNITDSQQIALAAALYSMISELFGMENLRPSHKPTGVSLSFERITAERYIMELLSTRKQRKEQHQGNYLVLNSTDSGEQRKS